MLLKYRVAHRFLAFLVILLLGFRAEASHIMGGSITYECQGNGNYVFQLVFYRDCNGAEVNTNSQTLKVWNHPTLNSITVPYVSTEDISPEGTQTTGGPQCFNCDTPNGNIGIGSIQRITYRSAPVNLSGVPPTQGWVITFDDFSRNGNITNLQNPLNYGITLTAKLFNVNAQNNTCHDNSPQFLQNPHFVSCVGKPFKLNLNPVDPDLDSMAISFDQPLNNLNNSPYAEGVNPSAVPFVAGFSTSDPTPTVAMMAGNQSAQINPLSGEITFLSNLTGNFNVKIKVTSFRNGRRISEVAYEMQLIVTNCTGNNNPPLITPPFSGSFETTVMAGDIVNFNLNSTDAELLQNGTPQTNTILPTGLLFGPDPSVNGGCLIAPCPTVNPALPISGIQGASSTFNWQTDCAHLLDASGNELDMVPYQFVFRVQDDYCPIPEVVYETVTVKVVNPGVIQAPEITCIQGSGAGDFTINWTPVTNPNGTFVSYQIHTVQNGLIATIPAIGTTSYTHTGVTDDLDYFITVVSGCSGQALRNSDTVSNIYLDLSNLNPGTAVLDWNNPTSPAQSSMGGYYYIHREYPAGVWSVIDSVPYGTTHYSDVIDICSYFLNYRISLNNTPCNFMSQINGNTFTDQTPPEIPNLVNVTIDTLTGETSVVWNPSSDPDTYGYIVYMQDPVTGYLTELDTIFGKFNTTYTYLESYSDGSVTYTVAAFDSCPSPTGDPFNLSARDPNFHTTIYLQSELSVCDGSVRLFWNPYGGWPADSYDVFIQTGTGSWQLVQTVNQLFYSFTGTNLENYKVAIRANKGDGIVSFSNVEAFTVKRQSQPAYSYIRFASVQPDNQAVTIDYIFDPSVVVTKIELQRLNKKGVFEVIEEVVSPQTPHTFTDGNVSVDEESYTYRVVFYDSCGNPGAASNTARTILLNTQIDNTQLKTYLTWTPYQHFNGSVLGYYIYRAIDDVYAPGPIAFVGPNVWSFEEDIYDIDTEGKICYRVEAVEAGNIFADPQTSMSNQSCVLVEPLIYVPNAFYPEGINSVFIPVLRNYDFESYRMTILNRWGQVVFQTSNPMEGWNGRVNNTGAEAETTTYVYVIEINNGYGEQIMTRGHVTLLR